MFHLSKKKMNYKNSQDLLGKNKWLYVNCVKENRVRINLISRNFELLKFEAKVAFKST